MDTRIFILLVNIGIGYLMHNAEIPILNWCNTSLSILIYYMLTNSLSVKYIKSK